MPQAILKRLGRMITLRRQVRAVTWLVPSRYWYRTAIYASRMHGWLTARFGGGNRLLTEAVMLDLWLRELTLRSPYPIPWRGEGVEVLRHDDPKQGVMYCWTHVPLCEIPLRALMEMGHNPQVAADPGKIGGDHEFIVPGAARRLRAIRTDPYALLKMRTVLRGGGSVAWLADAKLGAPLSPRVLRFAGTVGARVIFLWAEHGTNGAIDVHFADPPFPLCRSEEDLAANMEFLRTENRRLLGPLGIGGSGLDGASGGVGREAGFSAPRRDEAAAPVEIKESCGSEKADRASLDFPCLKIETRDTR